MKFGIVIPAFNARGFITDAIMSVRGQSFDDFLCVVVDDASSDGTAQTAQQAYAGDSRFSHVSLRRNGGQSAAKNVGAGLLVDVDWLIFLDADDMLRSDCLELLARHIARLDTNAMPGAVGFQYFSLDRDGRLMGARRSRYVPSFPLPRDLRDDELITPLVTFVCVTGHGPFYAFRRELFGDGYDETLRAHEDADICLRFALAGPVHFLPDRLYVKRMREGSMTVLGQASGSGAQFELKWAARAKAAGAYSELGRAMRHYYLRHVPLRDLKVAVTSARAHDYRKAGQLVLNAARGLSGWSYFKFLVSPTRR